MISRIVHDARDDVLYRASVARVRSSLSGREKWRVDIERSASQHPPVWSLWKRSKTFEDESEARFHANLILDSLTYIEESG